jgi:hypothetical protein
MTIREENLKNAETMLDMMEGRIDSAMDNMRKIRAEIEGIRVAISLDRAVEEHEHPPNPLQVPEEGEWVPPHLRNKNDDE